jgi:hypothetical protein
VTPSIDLVIEAGDWPQEETLKTWFEAAIRRGDIDHRVQPPLAR